MMHERRFPNEDDVELVGTATIAIGDCCYPECGATAITVGIYLTRTGQLRLAYEEAVRQLTMLSMKCGPTTGGSPVTAADLYRLELERKFYSLQTSLGKAITRRHRALKPVTFGNPGKHSAKYTGAATRLMKLGRGCTFVGISIDITIIILAEEDERPAMIARATGSFGGALAGSAAIGAACGSCFGPPGAAAGAIGGAVFGACMGDWLVQEAIEW